VLDFVESKEEILQWLLKHLECPAIVDLIVRIVAVDDIEERRTILNWMVDHGFLIQVIERLSPQRTIGEHINVSQILTDIINMASVSSVHALQQLAQHHTVQALFWQILDEEGPNKGSALIHGLMVLIVLIHRTRHLEDYPEWLDSILCVIDERLDDIINLLETPLHGNEELATPGGKIRRFGMERLKVCELLEQLFCIDRREFNIKLCQSRALDVLLACMVHYPWNNLLHIHINNIIDNITVYPLHHGHHPIIKVRSLLKYESFKKL
jgi:hypothetical protein